MKLYRKERSNDHMKTLVFVTSFLSPHVLPLLNELSKYYSIIGCIQTMHMTRERKSLGYEIDCSFFRLISYQTEQELCRELCSRADVVCMACGCFELLKTRIRENKEVFILHERLFKKGLIKLVDPRLWKYVKICSLARKKPIYLLAIGKNAAKDFCLLGFPKEKIYYYGYFPKVEVCHARQSAQSPVEILWVGRMVGFKRPMMAVKLAKRLPSDYHLTMIGDGKKMRQVRKYIKKHRLNVLLTGQLDNASVRDAMKRADIFLSTSDKGEGWGAVINEGMSCGCAIVCSDCIGCHGIMVDEENACIFPTYSMAGLYQAVRRAAALIPYYSQKSIEKIESEINPTEAAYRFYRLENLLASGQKTEAYMNGICSRMQ